MELHLQTTARHLDLPEPARTQIRRLAEKLQQFFPRIVQCRVLVEAEHRYPTGPVVAYAVRIEVSVPQTDLFVTEQRAETLRTAIQRAFDAARRQVEDYARTQREEMGEQLAEDHGRVSRIFQWEGYGFIEARNGRQIYFHRNAVLHDGFDQLEPGDEVRFAEEPGDEGPQASTVVIVSPRRTARQHQAEA